MKFTTILYKHHIGRMINRHWYLQGRIKVSPTPTEDILKSYGYKIEDIEEVLRPYLKKKREKQNEIIEDKVKCLTYGDSSVLLEGLEQAKVLTNTVQISEDLPEDVINKRSKISLDDSFDSEIKKRVMLSCVFEATQAKLPVRKDPLRPAFNFPRDYGIDSSRKIELLFKNILNLCDKYNSSNSQDKSVVFKPFFSVPFQAHDENISFGVTSELVITTEKNELPLAEPNSTHGINLPDISPLKCTVSLTPSKDDAVEDIYPFSIKSRWPYVHTVFLGYDPTVVKNLFEEEVFESQFQSRSLVKGFCVAAAQARAFYGDDVKELPKPFVVRVIQTDGKRFHFTVFQLNTLDIDGNSQVKNIFWHTPSVHLYEKCEYTKGKPILEDYNPDVIKNFMALL